MVAGVLVTGLSGLLAAGPVRAAPNDEPFAASQWGLRQIGAPAAWDVTRGSGARVGVIDTGIDLGHAELAGRVVASTTCLGTRGLVSGCGGTAQDDAGHGTHVAGTVAAPVNGSGVAGVAPEASLLVVKALNAEGAGNAFDVVAGIDWLLSQGVHVVNLSLSEVSSLRQAPASPLAGAIERAYQAGVVVVVSAGNNPDTSGERVASDLAAIVVGATGRDGRMPPYSAPLDSGVRWGLVAPGGDGTADVKGDVISTSWFAGRRSSYAWSSGTSMATAHVSGVAALLAARGVVGKAAIDQMLATTAPTSCGPGCRGLVDATAATAISAAAVAVGTTPAAPPAVQAPAAPAAPVTAPAALPAALEATVPVVVALPQLTVEGPADTGVTGGGQVAMTPVLRPLVPEVPIRSARAEQLAWFAVGAGGALLSVAAGSALLGRRRVRGAAGW